MYIEDSTVGISTIGDYPLHRNGIRFHRIPLPVYFRGRRVDTKILLDQFASCIDIIDQFKSAVCNCSQMI